LLKVTPPRDRSLALNQKEKPLITTKKKKKTKTTQKKNNTHQPLPPPSNDLNTRFSWGRGGRSDRKKHNGSGKREIMQRSQQSWGTRGMCSLLENRGACLMTVRESECQRQNGTKNKRRASLRGSNLLPPKKIPSSSKGAEKILPEGRGRATSNNLSLPDWVLSVGTESYERTKKRKKPRNRQKKGMVRPSR